VTITILLVSHVRLAPEGIWSIWCQPGEKDVVDSSIRAVGIIPGRFRRTSMGYPLSCSSSQLVHLHMLIDLQRGVLPATGDLVAASNGSKKELTMVSFWSCYQYLDYSRELADLPGWHGPARGRTGRPKHRQITIARIARWLD
jgi:hypothetical protein